MSPAPQFLTFYQSEPIFNTCVIIVFAGVISLFIAGVTEKVDGVDNTVDFMKVFIVIFNVVLLAMLLYKKNILTKSKTVHRVVFGCGLFAIAFVILLNLSIMGMLRSTAGDVEEDEDSEGAEEDNRTPLSWVPYNYDYLTIAVTISIDLLYLYLYAIFKAKVPTIITMILLIVNIIIFAIGISMDSDLALDIANFVTALITCWMAVYTWTGKVTLSDDGAPVELVEFSLLRDASEV